MWEVTEEFQRPSSACCVGPSSRARTCGWHCLGPPLSTSFLPPRAPGANNRPHAALVEAALPSAHPAQRPDTVSRSPALAKVPRGQVLSLLSSLLPFCWYGAAILLPRTLYPALFLLLRLFTKALLVTQSRNWGVQPTSPSAGGI